MQFSNVQEDLCCRPRKWLITGVAGFIGSNLLEALLSLGQQVVGLDNFSSGYRKNVQDVLRRVPDGAARFHLIEGDICDAETCRQAVRGVDYVLHQAAIVSVPRSLLDPVANNRVNVNGMLNMLVAARDAKVARMVYASSSAVYGDVAVLPVPETTATVPLSPYGVSKLVNEQYAAVFSGNYHLQTVGLRYFNVFGPRQDPLGGYAAVIPQWIHQLNMGEVCRIHGDGETSRDFVSVADVVQANILAAVMPLPATQRVYNVGAGRRTSLNELHRMLAESAAALRGEAAIARPEHGDFRAGDIRHSQADIALICAELGYVPAAQLTDNLARTLRWYFERMSAPELLLAHETRAQRFHGETRAQRGFTESTQSGVGLTGGGG